MTTTTVDPDVVRLWDAADVLGKRSETAASVVRKPSNLGTPGAGLDPQAVVSVLDCIKRAESGDYTEHSHTSDGSGAYQYIGSTWRAWSARAGYPGWQLAYEAPPAVQDAVTVYALTHGGAGNWSMRYGRDSCTSGLPGGG